MSDNSCVDIDYDDSGCASMNSCCVGVHDFGQHGKCTSAVRRCRKLGNVWSPPRPLRALPGEYIYNDLPGYATTGAFVGKEGFIGNLGMQFLNFDCIMKNAVFGIVVTTFLSCFQGRGLEMQEILAIALVASVLKCVLSAL